MISMDSHAEINALREKLDELSVDTQKMQELFQQRVDEVKYQKDILFALDFVDFTNKFYIEDNFTLYDWISTKMREHKEERIAAQPLRFKNEKK